MQDAAKKLKATAAQYEYSPIVETAKRIASMWFEMALLIRSELQVIPYSGGLNFTDTWTHAHYVLYNQAYCA